MLLAVLTNAHSLVNIPHIAWYLRAELLALANHSFIDELKKSVAILDQKCHRSPTLLAMVKTTGGEKSVFIGGISGGMALAGGETNTKDGTR